MKNYKYIFVSILVLLLLLVAVYNLKSNLVNKTTTSKIKKMVVYKGNEEIYITDEVDLENIKTFLLNMKSYDKQQNSIDGIKGKIYFDNDSIKNFILQKNMLQLGDKIFEGEECNRIFDIIKKHIYDKKLIVEKLKIANEIVVLAEDINKKVKLDEKNKKVLIETFLKANILYSDDYPNGIPAPEYPHYSIKFDENTIYIINKNMLVMMGEGAYLTDDILWETLNNILNISAVKDKNNISYLFNANKVEIKMINNEILSGDYTGRKATFVRSLMGAKLIKEKELKSKEVKLIMKFYIGQEMYEVNVYEDGYKYLNKYYEKENIYNDLENIIISG